MKKKTIAIATVAGLAVSAAALGVWLASDKPKEEHHAHCAVDTGEKPTKVDRTTGPINFGRFMGEVVREETNGMYFLQLRGARLPFKASPLQAQSVELQAPGQKALEKNTALLYAIMGKEVEGATLLINPEEEDQVLPAAQDIARYVKVANSRKFAGVAYTKPGGKLQPPETSASAVQAIAQKYGVQIAEAQPPKASPNTVRALEEATAQRPFIQLKGPKSGATKTGVSIVGPGQILVEGKTYDDLFTAADYIGITLLKMLCGSSECPDAAACATGGKCGCGG
jgi:hypothetical protein